MAKKDIETAAIDDSKAKLQALQAAMSKIEKDFGKGSIM
ncbi:MAG: DNA recombination/repair protein RecA, partial [Bacteroidaceae bacterium]|nr:DNA recombination/repair protein RecA [Bacteroidaceae bacterium]